MLELHRINRSHIYRVFKDVFFFSGFFFSQILFYPKKILFSFSFGLCCECGFVSIFYWNARFIAVSDILPPKKPHGKFLSSSSFRRARCEKSNKILSSIFSLSWLCVCVFSSFCKKASLPPFCFRFTQFHHSIFSYYFSFLARFTLICGGFFSPATIFFLFFHAIDVNLNALALSRIGYTKNCEKKRLNFFPPLVRQSF